MNLYFFESTYVVSDQFSHTINLKLQTEIIINELMYLFNF